MIDDSFRQKLSSMGASELYNIVTLHIDEYNPEAKEEILNEYKKRKELNADFDACAKMQDERINNDITQEKKDRKSQRTKKIASFAGTIIGLIIGKLLGFNILPLLGIFLIYWFLKNTVDNPGRQVFMTAISVQLSHLLWYVFGFVYLVCDKDFNFPFLLEIMVFGAAIVLFFWHPGKKTSLLLLIYQLVGAIYAIYTIFNMPYEFNSTGAVITHLLLRVSAIILMVTGLVKLDKLKHAAQNEAVQNEAA